MSLPYVYGFISETVLSFKLACSTQVQFSRCQPCLITIIHPSIIIVWGVFIIYLVRRWSDRTWVKDLLLTIELHNFSFLSCHGDTIWFWSAWRLKTPHLLARYWLFVRKTPCICACMSCERTYMYFSVFPH